MQTERSDRGSQCSVSKWFVIGKCIACLSFCVKSLQIFRMIKLAQRMFVFFISLRNLGKFSIVSAFCSSFAEKEKMSMFSLFCGLIANFEYAGFAQKNKYTAWTVSIVTVFAAKS